MTYEHRSDDQLRDDIKHLTRTAQHARADRTITVAMELEGIAREKEAELARRAGTETADE